MSQISQWNIHGTLITHFFVSYFIFDSAEFLQGGLSILISCYVFLLLNVRQDERRTIDEDDC